MKDKKLRSMLVDCIRYHKKTNKYWFERPYTLKTICDVNTNHVDVTLEYLLECAEERGVSPKDVQVVGYSRDDYDGYSESFVSMDVKVASSDAGWLEEISNYLSPQWQYDRYKQYWNMKGEFEDV